MITGRMLGFVVLADLCTLISTNELLSIIIYVQDATNICEFGLKKYPNFREYSSTNVVKPLL